MKSAHTHQLEFSKEAILDDYRIAFRSRLTSIIARQEVFLAKLSSVFSATGRKWHRSHSPMP